MVWLVGIALAVALIALAIRRSQQTALIRQGLEGEIVASDLQGSGEMLVSDALGLVGKPDYIVRDKSGALIPVERKSRRLGRGRPRDGEILQLAAYGLLIQDCYGCSVRKGRLQYADRTVALDLEAWGRQARYVLTEMRAAERAEDVHRSHEHAARCEACGVRDRCGEALQYLAH